MINKEIENILKVYNFDAHALRGRHFFKGILDYRAKILPRHKWRIKRDRDFQCVLCFGRRGKLFLEWQSGYRLFSCPVCGAVSANITADTKHIDDVYNNKVYYRKFEQEILKHYAYRKKTQGVERYDYTIKRLGINPKKARVLDLGCGAGYFVSVLKERGIPLARGLEVNPAQVRYCRRRGLNVAGADLADEPDGFYDLITMFDVLEHLPDPIAVMKIAAKKLSPGGFVVAYTPNIHSLAYYLMGSAQNTLLPFEHFCFYNKKSFAYLARKSGFLPPDVEIRGFDVMDYLLMKEYKDGVNYTDKLGKFMNVLQACVDKLELGNHFRVTFRKAGRLPRAEAGQLGRGRQSVLTRS